MADDDVLPCNPDGICMICHQTPSPEEILSCTTCTSPWHVTCLSVRPDTVADALEWGCPDCAPAADPGQAAGNSIGTGRNRGSGGLVAAIKAVEADESLTEREKAKKRQELMSKTALPPSDSDGANPEKNINGGNDVLDIFDGILSCTICMQLPERPVTVSTPPLQDSKFCFGVYLFWIISSRFSTLRINVSTLDFHNRTVHFINYLTIMKIYSENGVQEQSKNCPFVFGHEID